ncbi:MAG: TetR/AcrR family transcriptional regulator [Arcobacteraceae bacterium]
MAKVVDKIEKRKNIALSCKDLFVNNSLQNLTISKIAQTAGIGKGSLYDYFENKEDIVFELIDILLQESDLLKQAKLQKASSTQEKLKIFFDFYYAKETEELREIFKDFTAISLTNPNEKILKYQTKIYDYYNTWLKDILQEGIDKNELSKDALKYAGIFLVLAKGTFLSGIITTGLINLEEDLNLYIDFIFQSMKGNK